MRVLHPLVPGRMWTRVTVNVICLQGADDAAFNWRFPSRNGPIASFDRSVYSDRSTSRC